MGRAQRRRKRIAARAAWVLALCWAVSGISWAEPLRIAAASDLRFALTAVQAQFAARFPDESVDIVYGSSGRFRTQIEHGAPFDLYFSADIAYPEALAESGLVVGQIVPYAVGRLVLWSRTHDASTFSLEDLERPELRRIAIANPRHAPYGARAEEALRAVGVWDAVQPRLVMGENISQTLQMIQSGAADIGLVALALVLHPAVNAEGDFRLIDDTLHTPLTQAFVVTQHGAEKPLARTFAEFMREPEVLAVMRRYGFVLPDEFVIED